MTETVRTDGGRLADSARRAAEVLDGGGLVVFPTETVYGLAARADLPDAMSRLRRIKSRDSRDAFTLHVGSVEMVQRYANDLPAVAERLMRKTWPGPVTLIVPVGDPAGTSGMKGASEATIAAVYHEHTVGLRCPGEAVARRLLSLARGPVVAASANLAGRPPPTTAGEACEFLDSQRVDLVVDSGPTRYARPSTIVQTSPGDYQLVREGVYDAGMIERLAVLRVVFVCTGNTCRSPMAEGFAQRLLADRVGCAPSLLIDHDVDVYSAGTCGGFGEVAAHGVAVMAKRGIDISSHRSKALSAADINDADLVLVMTHGHRAFVLGLAPDAGDRVLPLVEGEDVFDPIGGTQEDYERCARLIERGVRHRLMEVKV